MAGRRYGTVPRDLPDNERFWTIGPDAARLLFLLTSQADDFGRFEGDPVKVRNICYRGAHERDVTSSRVEQLLTELSDAGLVFRYLDRDDRGYLELVDHVGTSGQRLERFPPPSKQPDRSGKVAVPPNLFRGPSALPASMPDRSGASGPRAAPESDSTVASSDVHPVPVPRPVPLPRDSSNTNSRSSAKADSVKSERGLGVVGKPLTRSQHNEARFGFARSLGDGLGIDHLADDRFVEFAFRRAVDCELVPGTSGGRQTVYAAAEQARMPGTKNPIGLFVHLVCGPNRKGLTEAADKAAERRVKRLRGEPIPPRVRSALEEVFDEER